jgi:hypothetical protein
MADIKVWTFAPLLKAYRVLLFCICRRYLASLVGFLASVSYLGRVPVIVGVATSFGWIEPRLGLGICERNGA